MTILRNSSRETRKVLGEAGIEIILRRGALLRPIPCVLASLAPPCLHLLRWLRPASGDMSGRAEKISSALCLPSMFSSSSVLDPSGTLGNWLLPHLANRPDRHCSRLMWQRTGRSCSHQSLHLVKKWLKCPVKRFAGGSKNLQLITMILVVWSKDLSRITPNFSIDLPRVDTVVVATPGFCGSAITNVWK